MNLNYETELYKGGLHTTIKVVSHDYDNIEITFKRKMNDESSGKPIIDSQMQMFFTEREFRSLFLPLFNEMKVRFDHVNESESSN